MGKIHFLFGLHNHQPIGNFEHVLREAYEKSYLPIIETFKKFPAMRFALHHSGCLLEWIEKNRPEYLDAVGDMVAEGRVEILGGGFYEPILSTLPEGDAIGQLEMMNRWVEKRFGVRPRGAWLAERIWDPALPRVLSAAGLEYTLLDDTHFYFAGLSEENMFGYYVTERHGSTTAIFPIDKFLRYSIPFKQPEETLEYFKGLLQKYGSTGVTYGDDGEKFGVWPETHEWVFGKKWLERFLTMLSENTGIVETITYSDYLDRFPPRDRVYLPMASYEEMTHWSLPVQKGIEYSKLLKKLEKEERNEEFKSFLRGGVWDNFLVKYEESNRMHKKMIYMSNRIKRAEKKSKSKKAVEKIKTMRRELYRGQCNCPYWHGLFGGLYLSNLRHAVHSHLIEAGKAADKILHKDKYWTEINIGDFSKSRNREAVVETPELFVLLDPSRGATLAEIDFKPAAFNLSNVLARRPEEYHQKIIDALSGKKADEGEILSIHDRVRFKDENLDKKLVFDRYPRRSFLDHFYSKMPGVEDMRAEKATDISGLTEARYETVSAKEGKNQATLVFAARGTVGANEKKVKVQKKFKVSSKKPEVRCEYILEKLGGGKLDFVFGVEWNFTLLAEDSPDRYITLDGKKYAMNSVGEDSGVDKWSITDEWFRFGAAFKSSNPVTLLHFPVETVSQSEDGFQSNYQGTAFIALQKVSIPPKGKFKTVFSLSLKTVQPK